MMASNGPAAVRASKQVGDVVSTVLQTPDGESVSLKVQRGKDQQPMDILVQPRRAAPSGPQTIGVLLSPNFKEIQKIQSNDLAEAAQLAFKYFSEIFSQTLNGLLSLLSMLVTGKGLPPGQSVSGPIGLIRTGTEVISTQDLTAVFMFAAALSVNLGVVNALPLPALDGGQLAFVIAEAITGRKVDQRFQEGITSVAILFLLLISVSTAFSDVGSILSGK
jgi:RIP metalloprotease RseP